MRHRLDVPQTLGFDSPLAGAEPIGKGKGEDPPRGGGRRGQGCITGSTGPRREKDGEGERPKKGRKSRPPFERGDPRLRFLLVRYH